jgi:transposase
VEQVGIYALPSEPLPQLSDELWQRLQSLLAVADPQLDAAAARLMVQAVLYRQLTGSAWSQVPVVEPERAEAAYERWKASGLLEQLAQVLRLRLDD